MRMIHWSNEKLADNPASYFLNYEVTTTDRSGTIEQLEQQIETLTKLVGAMLDQMSDTAQEQVLSNLFYWRKP